MSFGDIRSIIQEGDETALFYALRSYDDPSVHPLDVITYVRESWGYCPASTWEYGEDTQLFALKLSGVSIPSLKPKLMRANILIGGTPYLVGEWPDAARTLQAIMLPWRQALFDAFMTTHGQQEGIAPQMLELVSMVLDLLAGYLEGDRADVYEAATRRVGPIIDGHVKAYTLAHYTLCAIVKAPIPAVANVLWASQQGMATDAVSHYQNPPELLSWLDTSLLKGVHS